MKRFVSNHQLILYLIAALAVLALPALAALTVLTYSGTLASSGSTDYPVDLNSGDYVYARESCDEVSPGDRPLDPYLIVKDPSDSTVASNDDGNLPNCNAFSSSCVTFTAATTGTYTFRAGQAASVGGPYTLLIVVNDPSAVCSFSYSYEPPTEEPIKPSAADPFIDDGRANSHDLAASFALYCPADGIEVYVIGEANIGQKAFLATWDEIAQFPTMPESNTLITEGMGVQLYRLTTGEFALIGPVEADGKTYDLVFSDCPRDGTYVKGFMYPDQAPQ